jgi:2-isopropylmalate synthase
MLEDQDLTQLLAYCRCAADGVGWQVPINYPLVGRDAFRTATGVHAAAIIKAFRKNDRNLANSVYSGVPSHLFGLEQIIEVGPMSGKSNVIYWLESRDIPATDDLVNRIFDAAKQSTRILTEAEILSLCRLPSGN